MLDRTLLTIAFTVSLGGMIALFLIMRFTEPIQAAPFELSALGSEDVIMLNGTVLSASGNGKATFIGLSVVSYAEVVFFADASLEPGDNVSIIGRVSERDGKRGVIAERVAKK